ncbi:FdhF/YdeP family oxidoreductase [Mangrovimonas sp. YM274]|uniref:FdhF/YdeP family oxidoreductase n=1 Tax=Mangrovimonas sp. YM274 TaxID=3070660 RepID=UPI0027DC0A3D|nr:FdhF/YdeP family oxidoreductase [Mangrovimonas sp. YM274]WMI69059.1 FdhF/YdeP family oxidoreductase [Mangrovimonas sp. YM274]
MSKSRKRDISIHSNPEFTGLELTTPGQYAAGPPAIKVAFEHVYKEMGIVRGLRTLSHMNQKGGFDCPGCAWPDPEKRSSLGEYCENGAKALAEEATTKKVDRDFFSKYSVEELSRWSDYEIGRSGRLMEPMVLRPNSIHYEPISWAEAFSLIAEQLHSLQHPDEAIFYTSGRSSNEAAFLYGLFARAFGTNNMPDCSNMCHESSGIGLSETLGIGKGSVTLEDFNKAEVVMVIGQNPGTNHPRMLSALEKCKSNGGTVISVNPLEEAGLIRFKNPQEVNGLLGSGVALTDIHLQVKINQDIALLKLIQKRLAALDQQGQQVFDHEFIKTYTHGYDAFIKNLGNDSEAALLNACGVPSHLIDEVVNILAKSNKIIICWAMGLTQHKNGVDNIKECVNLLLLKGCLGKPGAGTCPVRGHSNVQGDRTVGIMHYVSKNYNQAVKDTFNFDPPTKSGYDVVHAIQAMHNKDAKVFIGLGGNFVSAASDTEFTAEALQHCELTVQISTKLNRSHLITGQTALILPTLGRSEIDMKGNSRRHLTVENSMGVVHQTKGMLPPASSHLKSEPEIVSGIAHAYFQGNHPVDWLSLGSNYDLVREKLGQVVQGFKDVNTKSKDGGYYLPNNVRRLDFSRLPNQRAQFSITQAPKHELDEGEYLLMTIRSHDQFNTTIYGLDDRYRGIHNERRVILMNPKDMDQAGFAQRDVVNIMSHYNGVERKVYGFIVVAYNIPQGNLAAYFPETNALIPIDQFADKSHTPISKSIKVSLELRS